MKDVYLDLLLRIRRQQPKEWELLDPELKIRALNYEARERERLELEHEEETEAA